MQHFGLFISHKNASCRAVLCATSDTDYDHPCKGCANAVFHRLPMQGQFICVLQTGFILRTKMTLWWSTVSIMLCFMGYLVITSLHIYMYIGGCLVQGKRKRTDHRHNLLCAKYQKIVTKWLFMTFLSITKLTVRRFMVIYSWYSVWSHSMRSFLQL